MSGQFLRVRELFEAGLEIPAADRRQWLRDRCGEHQELEREVGTLLDAHDASNAFFDLPIQQPAAEDRPTRLGPYEVLEEIGRGGMGTVYRAVRIDDTFRKIVAIKVMGGFHLGLTERFQRERQILARLEHPNIARVLDGGSQNGVPYLVMEYVPGERINEYCESKKLDIRARLALIIQLCQAVDYTHRNLIVHRDLKPANVLITADGTVKLLDFGIAKILESEAPEGLTRTLHMTPDFASPEQLRGLPATTASDVYGLGVILFQLLTGGARPRVTTGANLAEIIESASKDDPPAPSEKAPASLRSQLRGDLDAIVLTALAIDPQRRYGTAARLEDDIRAFLQGLPVSAHADTLVYRARKFAIRRWPSLSIAAAVIVALVSAAAISLRQAQIAERRYQDVRALATTVLFDIHDKIRNLPGAAEARRLTATKALHYLDALSRQSENDMVLQGELAAAYERAGNTLGDFTDVALEGGQSGLPLFEKSLQLRQKLYERKPADDAARDALASAHERLGVAKMGVGRVKDALPHFQTGISLSKPGSPTHVQLLTRVSACHAGVEDMPKAIHYSEQALTLAQSGKEGWTPSARDKAISRGQRQTGILLSMAGRHKESIRYLELAAESLTKLVHENPNDVNHARLLATMLPFLAKAYDDDGRPQHASRVLLNSRAQLLEMTERSPTDPQVVLTLTWALKRLGTASHRDMTGDLGYADWALALKHGSRLAANPKASMTEISAYAESLLTVPFSQLQNHKQALDAAIRGNTLARSQNAEALKILGLAYFRNKDSAAAIQTMEQALALMPPGNKSVLRTEIEDRLREFRKLPPPP